MLNLAEGVVCMTGFALAMAQKEKVRHLVSDTVFRVRGERGEDLGFKRMDRPLAEQLTPPVQVRVPRLYWEQYEGLTETGLTWLHHERRMTFKEFVKLTLLTADRLFAQDARASRFAGRACVNLGLIAAIAPRKA